MGVGPPLHPFGPGTIGTQLFDWRATLLSQYANSPIITALIDYFDQWLDATTPIDNFFDQVWNIETAQGWGLDVWGRIVGVGRALTVSARYFGFEEGGTLDYDPFNQSPFYSPATTSNFLLSDTAYRQLILAKAFANISGGTIPEINKILSLLFADSGPCYVTDPGDMTMVYTFLFIPTPVQRAIITQSGVLPRPTGVAVSFLVS